MIVVAVVGEGRGGAGRGRSTAGWIGHSMLSAPSHESLQLGLFICNFTE